MTLIDKLNEHKEIIAVLRGTEKQDSHEAIFLGHHLLGYQTAIDIVKEHSEYVSVDEKLPNERVKVLAWHSRKEKFFIATYDRELKVWLNDGKPYSSEFLYSITHWMSIPKIPNQGE